MRVAVSTCTKYTPKTTLQISSLSHCIEDHLNIFAEICYRQGKTNFVSFVTWSYYTFIVLVISQTASAKVMLLLNWQTEFFSCSISLFRFRLVILSWLFLRPPCYSLLPTPRNSKLLLCWEGVEKCHRSFSVGACQIRFILSWSNQDRYSGYV